MVSAESSSSPLAASAKWIPCFVTFALALTAEVLANDQLFARFKKISCGSATGRGNGSEDEICPRLQAACG